MNEHRQTGKKCETIIIKTKSTTENTNKTPKINKIITTIDLQISIINLNTTGFNSPCKRQKMTE